MFSETKHGESFPINHFFIQGFANVIRSDRTCRGTGIRLCVRYDLPFRKLECKDMKKI